MDRAVFLDRDNTIIHNDGDLGDPEAVRLIQGAASAIASLGGLGYRIVVISNQGGVARGRFTEPDVEAVNRRVAELVYENSGGVIDRFYYCPYHPEGVVESYRREHPWRKPQPGMLLQAAEDLELDLGASWTVGDQERDVQAGRAAGTRTVLLQSEEPEGEGQLPAETAADLVAANLSEAARLIVQQPQIRHSGGEESGATAAEPEREAEIHAEAGAEAASERRPGQSGEHAGAGAESVADGQQDEQEMGDAGGGEDEAKAAAVRRAASERGASADALPPEGREVVSASVGSGDDSVQTNAGAVEAISGDADQAGAVEPRAGAPPGIPAAGASGAAEGDGVEASDGAAGAEAGPTAGGGAPDGGSSVDVGSADAGSSTASSSGGGSTTGAGSRSGVSGRSGSEPKMNRAEPSEPAAGKEEGTRGGDRASWEESRNEALLQQILGELRRQRADRGDFSLTKMLAGAVQMLALGCVAFALLTGGGAAALLGWLLGAVLAQLVVVTLLIVHGQR